MFSLRRGFGWSVTKSRHSDAHAVTLGVPGTAGFRATEIQRKRGSKNGPFTEGCQA